MKVAPSEPFKIVYSLFQHEYLGYLIESYVVQMDEQDRFSYVSQNVSEKNAHEFKSGLTELDFQLIKLTGTIQQDEILRKFNTKRIEPIKFFQKIFDPKTGDKNIRGYIEQYIDQRKGEILGLLASKERLFFEMGNDGVVTWKKLHLKKTPIKVTFNFFKNEDHTQYYPVLHHEGKKVSYQYKGAIIICQNPAYMLLGEDVFHFEEGIEGKKITPFLNKKYVTIKKEVEQKYYNNYIRNLIAKHKVFAKGFDIKIEEHSPRPVLAYNYIEEPSQLSLEHNGKREKEESQAKVQFNLIFYYGPHCFGPFEHGRISVEFEEPTPRDYSFIKIERDLEVEQKVVQSLRDTKLNLLNGKTTLDQYDAALWMSYNKEDVEKLGIKVELMHGKQINGKIFKPLFTQRGELSIKIRESADWFDIKASVTFGDYEISFAELRKAILKNQKMISLPNGQIAAIEPTWIEEYKELFAFLEEQGNNDTEDHKEGMTLKKHHLSLVKMLASKQLAEVNFKSKLQVLEDFEKIEDVLMPSKFNGTLRPYQKAGYNWMQFLHQYKLGGCLADDMGLGKTIQTLAHLQKQKEEKQGTSLLVMPTSLIYNWELEARKFTPNLRVYLYVGSQRQKNVELFEHTDIVITSYGIARIDADILKNYLFNYIILDESQIIKNPDSNTAKELNKLKSKHKLILTGTPLENTTMDLWSQMNFVNKGLLGSQAYFKKEFLTPIEKKGDVKKIEKLHVLIKPFIMRRHKSQVAKDLPPKIENLQYCTMTYEQKERYEESKNYYRNLILEQIQENGLAKSQIHILQGLSKLRQLANHPAMVEEDYCGDSGKMEEIREKLNRLLEEDHKVLIFSQFVKHLAIVKQHLTKEKIQFNYLDGSTTNRQQQVEHFQNDPSTKVFLISLKAGGVGLNLTAADYVFLLDPWYNPAVEQQAIDRTHRIGQDKNVFIYKFISKDTVEEKILLLQENKRSLAEGLISTEESFMKNLSKEDILSIMD